MTKNTVSSSTMTAGERSDLRSLIRQRAKLMKTQASQRGLELIAEFEKQLQTYFSFDQDEVWEAAYSEAEKAARDASAQIAQRCREMGIPEKFAPSLGFGWRGYGQNVTKEARADMRREAKLRIAAMEAAAKSEIERISVNAQTELIADGLTSEAAQTFLQQMPSAETLMPRLELIQVRGLLEQGDQSP